MAALQRVQVELRDDGRIVVTYRDTKTPYRTVTDELPPRGFVSVNEVARITGVPRRTMYYWAEKGELRTESQDGNYRVPISEVRRILQDQIDSGELTPADEE